jgi:hypothetical protein
MKIIPTLLFVHFGQSVLADSASSEKYCMDRLANLQKLIDNDEVEEAVRLSHSFSRDHDHHACSADVPFVGDGHFVSKVSSTPVGMGGIREHVVATHISIIDPSLASESDHVWIPVIQATNRSLTTRSPVVGFSLGGSFVLSDSPIKCTRIGENQQVKCDAGSTVRETVFDNEDEAVESLTMMLEEESNEHRRLSQALIPVDASKDLIDATTAYAVGTKKVLVIMTCPSDSANCGTQNYP